MTKTCSLCGREFDLSTVKRIIGHEYGAGTYNDYYPDCDVCLFCATEQIGADWATGAELIGLMGTGWDDD